MGGNGSGSKPRDPEARRVVLALLSRGLVSPCEITELSGFDRSTIVRWPKVAGVDWQSQRAQVVAALWRKEMGRGSKLVETAKSRSRK
jgi:DNA invertase Pin-like site-specific DNA recombinase